MNLLDFIYIPLALVTAPLWARKGRSGWGERFGWVAALPAKAAGRRRVLVHAVSVGEVAALRHLVPLLTPHAEVVISVTTDTGLARARELFGAHSSCHVVRYPLDFSWSVARFLGAVAPDAVALVELELWPNFIRACTERGVPVCVINGRLSARSFRGYRRARRFFATTFGRLAFAAVQDEAYAGRFEFMGVDPLRCFLTGSMKWDSARIEPAAEVEGREELARELGIDRGLPLIVAGSTGPGEEALLRDVVASLAPGVQLLCAPRKPERFDEAAAAMEPCVRRTRGGAPRADAAGQDRFLLDTIGELRQAYALADVVVVGRSFGDQFGSDPIEPVAIGRATVIGPATSDFTSVVKTLRDAGALRQVTRETLGRELAELLARPEVREQMAVSGAAAIRREQGASQRHAELLLELAGVSRPPGREGAGLGQGLGAVGIERTSEKPTN